MKIQRRNKSNPEFSLAAMVDVILLLLIFFMVTSAASNVSAIDVKLPKAEAENPNIPNETTVAIKENGTYYLDDKPVRKEELEQQVVSRLEAQPNPSFTIRADKNALHKDVVFVMGIAEKRKYSIAIATSKEE